MFTMNKLHLTLLLFLLLTLSCNVSNSNDTTSFETIAVAYPNALRDTLQIDTFFDKRVRNSYHWLEDGDLPTTRNWLSEQRTITQDYFNQLPARTAIRKRLETLWNYDRWSTPVKKGNSYCMLRNKGLQNRAVLYRMRNLQDTSLQVIVDPNAAASNGGVSLQDFSLSGDGSLLAYQMAANGADWQTIYIKDMETNRPLLDTVRWVQFSNIAWFRDGFFYSRYPAPMPGAVAAGTYQFQQVYYHRVGSPQSDDELIYADRSNPQCNFTAQTTADERYLILSANKFINGNALYVRDLQSESLEFTPIFETYDYDCKVIGNVGNNLLVLTNYKAPNYRLVQINAARPEERYWEQVIPEPADVLQTVHLYGGRLVATYLQNAISQLTIFDLRGKQLREVSLPANGVITQWSGSPDESQAFFTFTSFTRPPIIYALNLSDFSTQAYKAPIVEFSGNSYETRQVNYKSYDGTEVPMTLIYKKGMKLDGTRPTLLTCTNALQPDIYNDSQLRLFQIILENNGICAFAFVRGSAALGGTWQQGGIKLKKQTGIDDFQAAAEYLIGNKYTNPAKLAIYGQQDGALLVGASITQRPDMYQVALADAGIYDLLHYQLNGIGWSWENVYGNVARTDEFDAIMAYSPLQQVVPANYPATLILSAERDNWVTPADSYKFAAELQANQKRNLPILLRVDGWSGEKPISRQLDEAADALAFLFYNLQEKVVYK